MRDNCYRDLLEWLAKMGSDDRERYREIRALMWEMFVRNQQARSGYSDRPSKYS